MTNMEEQRVMFINIPATATKSRSVSPMSLSPPRDRGHGFFDILTRRFGRRSHDDICYQHHGEEDSRSSSTDSCSSSSGGHLSNSASSNRNYTSNLEISCSSDSSSSSNSREEAAHDTGASRVHRRSTSSLRRAFQNFSISSRSLSCSSTLNQTKNSSPALPAQAKKPKKSVAPKRILRQPVSYAYLKGMSGLPTQRVPRSSVCCHYANR